MDLYTKTEQVHEVQFRARAKARAAVFEYIEVFYNRQRLHSALGYCTPAESLFECVISMTYAVSAVSALSLEQGLTCKIDCPLLVRSLWARFRQPRRQGFLGQAIGIPYSNRL